MRIEAYSYLSASIGSNLAAFIAGHIPKINPIPHETVIPRIGAHVGTFTGKIKFTSKLKPQPIPTPSSPPEPVNDIASIRN